MIAIVVILALLLIGVMAMNHLNLSHQDKKHEKEREQWKIERQQLLDRIQANSFAEYKTAEVRVIKAQKDEQQVVLPEMV